MTRRQRILATLAHQRPDRTPAVLAARSEVDRGLMAHYGVATMDEVNAILGTDGWADVGFGFDFPGYAERTNGRLEGDMPYAGSDYVFRDARTFEDEWGVVRRIGSDGKYVQWITGPLANADDPDEYDFPGIDRIRHGADLDDRVRKLKDADLFVTAGISNPFKTAWELRGLENFLADYIANPRFVERLYDRIFATYGEKLARATAAGVDMISVTGDIAMQDRIIMGPALWRRFDKPRFAEMIGRCKRINPDVHVYIHSDGALWDLMDDLIAIGFDVIDPIQPECMDPVEVKRRYGKRITLHGGGSIQRTLPFGTPDDCRREAVRLVEKCGYDGGIIIRASNAIPYDTPIANVVAFFEAIRDHRW